ncbi:Rieske 2Fe-2S domain-containing protein [Candidatus Atelocyanobacterium thalassae]|uniref:Rieske domain-containing protein n=1 Tax=cyanobacterium endosymbiont of Braarudosphaera bigelowii TaxID=1285375 RepID=A0ABM7U557_9CHRO|nr:Rieske 2Fe-2S domain-containing protein [Candidatus Atelocyanobacterium thalassa]BDA39522.1 hypothetical protein CPARK_000036100 [cyanobacterium endosymbiont of Braarudosphaera bigelowii]
MTTLLRNCWYVALSSKDLKPATIIHKKILDEPILIGRKKNGQIFAMRDVCPHRGIPLSYGSLCKEDISCRYHGWKFNVNNGRCSEIPSLTEHDDLEVGRIQVRTYPCEEVQGNIWIYFIDTNKSKTTLSNLPPVPTIPDFGKLKPGITETMKFACNVDHAIIGLMDPAHGPYIHNAWWWRSGPRKFRVKEKHYEPVSQGFRLIPYNMPVSARPYKILGNNVSIEIVFQLPGIRTEILKGDHYSACLLTCITPIDESSCEIFQSIYWTIPWAGMFKPLLSLLTRQFLAQDRDAIVQQQKGLIYNPSLMLIDDADTQAKWYFRLKQEYQKSQEENRTFINPIEPRVLRWRS